MKHLVPLAVLFAAGVVASFALAAPPPGHGPPTSSSSSTSTSSGPGKSGGHAARCHPLNLKGTVSGGTLALNVTKAAGPQGKQLVGTVANLKVDGKVSAQVWACTGTGSSPTTQLTLRQLHVGGSPHAPTTTTTTP
jgi:hypothetical protein